MKSTTVQERDNRQNIVAELYLQGYSFRRIATLLKERYEISVTPPTVLADVKKLREAWKTRRNEAFHAAVEEELEKIDYMEAVAWEQFEQSKTHVSTRTKRRGSTVGNLHTMSVSETVTIEEQLPGDPRFLAIIDRCGDRRARLLGLYKSPAVDEVQPPDSAAPGKMIPAAFMDAPTFVVVGGTKDMIESEDDLPDE